MTSPQASELRSRDQLRWLEAKVQVNGEAAEAVSEFFNRLQVGGAVLEELAGESAEVAARTYWVKVYFPVGSESEEQAFRRRVEEGLWFLGRLYPLPEPAFRLLKYQDWAAAWKAGYTPLPVGQRIVIKPTWCDWQTDAGQVIVELDPGMAFGTGLHPSTQLALLGIERRLQPGQTVLDLGTGSGVLAIAAAKLGASRVLASDIDPQAIRVAAENVRGNHVEDVVCVREGSLPPRGGLDHAVVKAVSEIAANGFDLIVVNILAEVISSMLDQGLADYLAPQGILVTAGIIHAREQLVTTSVRTAGLRIVERRQEGDWVSHVARRFAPTQHRQGRYALS